MKDQILEVLMLSTFTTRKVLRLELISRGYMVSDRKMRSCIESMIIDDHLSILSSEKGYALIRDNKDLEDAMEYLDKKSSSIAIRKNCLLRNFRENKVGQLKLAV